MTAGLDTAGLLHRAFPALPQADAQRYADPFLRACHEFGVDASRARLAAFFAQIGHESAELTRWEESFAYRADQLLRVFPSRVKSLEQAQTLIAQGKQAIAEHVYGKRVDLGNTSPGDGWRYRGKGPIQITGKYNHADMGRWLKLDLVARPEQLLEPEAGFRSAGCFWLRRGLNALADIETVAAFGDLTGRINTARDGLVHRLALWQRARRVLDLSEVA